MVNWLNFSANTFCLLISIFLSACGDQFPTIDTESPTTSKPFDAEKFEVDLDEQSNSETHTVTSFCNNNELNGFTNLKKKEFVCSLLPGAIRMSKQVYKQRLQVQILYTKSRSTTLATDEIDWLNRIKRDYNLNANSSLEALLIHVDMIPLPLIIAQAAIESGWGTSRAALQGKNLFGIHGVFGKDQCLTAQKNKNVCIKKYTTTTEGISDYIQFLNTKSSTEQFRQKRNEFRSAHTPMDPLKLADTLNLYSETGKVYTRQVQKMMLDQNFIRFVFIESKGANFLYK